DERAQAAEHEGFADATMPVLLCDRLYDWKSNPLKVQSPVELSKTQAEVSSFIRESLEYHTKQRQQEKAKAAAERVGRRRRKLLAFTLLISFAALCFTVAIGFQLQKQAASRELASQALLALTQNPVRSAHIARAAVDQDPGNPAAKHALRQSLA